MSQTLFPRLHRHAWMDEQIEAFREQVRRYVTAELAPQLEGWRRQGYIPREVWQPFGALGFLLPELDEAWGGAGASLAYQLVVQDELARAAALGGGLPLQPVAEWRLAVDAGAGEAQAALQAALALAGAAA